MLSRAGVRLMPLSCRRGMTCSRAFLRMQQSDFALRGIPILFKICDQRRAEMAIGLFAAVDRHIATAQIERLYADTDGAAISGCADHARTGEVSDDPGNSGIHLIRWYDQIADHSAFGRVAV